MKKKAITVYGASSAKIAGKYFEAARAVGAAAARAGAAVVDGGEAIGVIPRFMAEKGWGHKGLTRMEVTETMHARKKRMADLGMGVIALPGGIGTLDELMEIITWRQLGLYTGNIVLLDTDGFYQPFEAMMRHLAEENFLRDDRREGLYSVTSDPEEAVMLALGKKN